MNCVDSTFLIDYLSESEGGPVEQFLTAREEEPFSVPSLVLNEVYRGAVLSAGSESIGDVDRGLDWIEPLPFTKASAREAALIESELQERGAPVDRMDVLIAGTAREIGATLVTRDDDFERIPDLRVVRY